MNGKNPLWLPKGSVRAILALSLVWGALYAALVLHDLVEASGLGILVVMVVKDYFEARANGM